MHNEEQVTGMGEMRNAYKVYSWKLKEERLLGISRLRLEDNIQMDPM